MPEEEGGEHMIDSDEGRFDSARKGDGFMCSFQCDVCHFQNIQGRNPVMEGKDLMMLRLIRRANLDAFWSREASTVAANLREVKRHVRYASDLGISMSLPRLGPFPLKDEVGMRHAVVQLRRTLDKGRHSRFIQFGTARKLRSGISNFWQASIEGRATQVMARGTSKMSITDCPVYSIWYERFMEGMHQRMGDIVHSDLAISIEVLLKMLELLEKRWSSGGSLEDRMRITNLAAFLCCGYTGGLRGEEVMLLSLHGLTLHLEEGLLNEKRPHVPITLLGRFKGETGNRYHIIPVAACTKSGVNTGVWMRRFVKVRWEMGYSTGFAFIDGEGTRMKASDLAEDFFLLLEQIQVEYAGLIGAEVVVRNCFGVYRSLRRGSTTHATNQGVKEADVDRNNRWRKVEAAKGKAASLSMRDHYTEIRQALPALLRYSSAL